VLASKTVLLQIVKLIVLKSCYLTVEQGKRR
jgi:hypothetical protein